MHINLFARINYLSFHFLDSTRDAYSIPLPGLDRSAEPTSGNVNKRVNFNLNPSTILLISFYVSLIHTHSIGVKFIHLILQCLVSQA